MVSLAFPVIALRCEDPLALDLQDVLLHLLQQMINGVEEGVDHLITLVLILGSCRFSQYS